MKDSKRLGKIATKLHANFSKQTQGTVTKWADLPQEEKRLWIGLARRAAALFALPAFSSLIKGDAYEGSTVKAEEIKAEAAPIIKAEEAKAEAAPFEGPAIKVEEAEALHGLNEGQKVTYDVQEERGKLAAVNLKG